MSQNQKDNFNKISKRDSITNEYKDKLEDELKDKEYLINKLNKEIEELNNDST